MLTLVSVAWALDAKVCARVPTNFLDADIGSTQDYQKHNATRWLRGVKIQVKNNLTQAVQTDFADISGADVGCADFTVSVGQSHTIRVVAEVDVNGAELSVLDPNDDAWYEVVDPSKVFFAVAPTATYTLTTSDVWNIVSAGAFALYRYDFGGAASTTFHTQDSSGNWNSPCGGSCIQGADAWFSPTKARQQFAITYAMGWSHLEVLGGVSFDDTMDEVDFNGGVGGIHLISPEFPSAAHAAGFAHLYSAVVYNDIDPACGMAYWQDANWDLLGTPDGLDSCFKEIETQAYMPFSCAQGRSPASSQYHQSAYYDAMGITVSTFETAMDVTRFWWDAMANEGLSYSDVVSIIDNTGPAGWHPTNALSVESEALTFGLSQAAFDRLSVRHGIE